MLTNATGRSPKYIGKPERIMVDFVEDRFNVKPENTIVVGDRLYTDIATGLNANVTAVAVLTGEVTAEDIRRENIKPNFTFNNVKNVWCALKTVNAGFIAPVT